MNGIRKLLHLGAAFIVGMALPSLFFVVQAHAQPVPVFGDTAKSSVCQGVSLTSGATTPDGTCQETSSTGVNDVIKLAVNVLSLIVGVAAVIMIIIGGLKYVTSQGESSNTAGAKNTILYALIGLVIVALAQGIVRFTLNKAASTQCPNGTSLQGSVCR